MGHTIRRSKGGSALLRKALWSGIYAGFGAIAAVFARRLASTVWRLSTGEEPPAKR